MGITTLVLLVSSLSFLLDRLLQYENVDEDSSGEHGHEKLVEDMPLALQQVSWALPLGLGGQGSLVAGRAGIRAQFDSFAPRPCSPPPTLDNSSVQPPAFASPACLLFVPEGAGMGPEPATPRFREAGLGAPRASGYQAEPQGRARTARRAPPPGKRPPSFNLCPAPSVSRKVFPTQRPTPGNSPRRAARSWFQPGRCFSS